MKRPDLLKSAASVILCQLAGYAGSRFTAPAIPTWYQSLDKPSFTPPDSIFAPVWIALYLMMGISLFLFWKKGPGHPHFRIGMILFFSQLILNTLWSIFFFGLRSPLLGLVDITCLWTAVLLTAFVFKGVSRAAGILLLPYLLWVSFAVVLNFSLWTLNR